MAARNYYIRDENPEVLKTLKEEYESMGRDCKIDNGCLTVYALKQKPTPPKKKFVKKPRTPRE